MAIVSSPLLSLHAHGKFAEQFVFARISSFNRVQKYSAPSGAASLAQLTARQNMTSVSGNWNDHFSSAQGAAAWLLYARSKSHVFTAANMFIRSALLLTPEITAPGMVLAAYPVGRVLVLKMLDAVSGNVSTETGLFQIARGLAADALIFKGSLSIKAGSILGPVAPIGAPYYYQIYKDNIPRSGIIALTHTQAATYGQLDAAEVTWDDLFNAGIIWNDLL